jgi:GT2 family glycosyltransferase
MNNPKIYIIVPNYKTWADTITCLESILRNKYLNYQIVVHDDCSPNNALAYLRSWAEGRLAICPDPDDSLQSLSFPGVPKPIPYLLYSRDAARQGGDTAAEREMEKSCQTWRYPLVFIQSEHNVGFAASNNICLEYALKKKDFEYAWLLNNDTVIAKDALVHLVDRARGYEKNQAKIGIIGTKLLYYDRPRIIQGVGGKYNKMLATTKHIGRFEADEGQYDLPDLKMDYVIGASMLVNKKFLNEVGLMPIEYFLYFEDIAWGISSKNMGWGLGYAYKSRVFHKEGATAGANVVATEKSIISEYYSLKNRVVFTKIFFPKYLWTVYFGFIMVILNRIKRRQFDRIKLIINILFHPAKPLDKKYY